MAQITSGIRRILDRPWVYRLMQILIGGVHLEQVFIRDYLQTPTGQRILDVGCGPKGYVAMLGDVYYLGIDLSAEYIERARYHSGHLSRFLAAPPNELRSLGEAPFDLIIAVGLLHHLDDDEAQALLQDSAALMKPEGRLVTLDNVYTDHQSTMARYLISRDQGQNVRDQATNEALGLGIFNSTDTNIRDDLLRIPYTHIITRWSDPVTGSHA